MDLTLKTATKTVPKHSWCMVMHHHATFARGSQKQNTNQIRIIFLWERQPLLKNCYLCCDCYLEDSNPCVFACFVVVVVFRGNVYRAMFDCKWLRFSDSWGDYDNNNNKNLKKKKERTFGILSCHFDLQDSNPTLSHDTYSGLK